MTARRTILDVTVTPKAVYTGEHEVDEGALIGETGKNAYGYSVAVKSVRLYRSGLRVRIESIRDGSVRHYIDLTSELVAYALPLLRQAAELGGPVEALRDGEWWTTCTMQELCSRVTEMPIGEVEALFVRLKAASTLANQAVELSDRASQDVARAAVVRRKREEVKIVLNRMQRDRRARGKDGATLLLRELGGLLRKRLGEEAANSLFAEARSKLDAPEPAT